ncbi:MAG: polysaccharide pyruvyl transferase family protein [Microbacteriaceae bacterium]
MHVLVIGDVGVIDGMMHIGDEAMFEAAVAELRDRGLDAVGVSSVPEESAERYGIRCVPRLGFAGLDRQASAARAEQLIAAASGALQLPDDDVALPALEALRGASGLLNAGGGNLASRWHAHVFERSTLAAMAAALGVPVVVSGQTFGPDLDAADAELVAGMVRTAAIASVRETASLELARGWRDDVRLVVDDASFLDAGAVDDGTLLVSLSGWFDHRPAEVVEAAIARAIDHAASVTGATVRFHAHFGPLDDPAPTRGDAALHERLRDRLTVPSEVLPTGSSRDGVRLARGARMLITGRYHPAVFAAPAGVPVLALAVDEYTRIKLTGALGHWGARPPVPIDELDAVGAATIEALHEGRELVRAAAAEREPAHRAAASAWWDDVAAAFRGLAG